LLTAAARVEPTSLRALDAIHLATALSLGHDLSGIVVYDRRLADAARGAGLTVWAPR
jgi:predicted nucleic acid-binding protein